VTSWCDLLARQQQILVGRQKLTGGLSATGTTSPTRRLCWRWWALRYRKTTYQSHLPRTGIGRTHPSVDSTKHPINTHSPTTITKASTLGSTPKIIQSYVNATCVRITSAGALPMTVASSTTGNASISPTVGGGNVTHCCGSLNRVLLQLQPILRQI
jgi:hypothetical protein